MKVIRPRAVVQVMPDDQNLTKQVGTRKASTASSETQCYRYDTLRRLTAAWTATDACAATPSSAAHSSVGDNLGTSSSYWTTWSYSAVGQRTAQVQHSLTGGSDTNTSNTYNGNGTAQPHALTSAATTGGATSAASYGYDKAGNMTSRAAAQGNQSLTWDAADRLTKVTAGTTTTEYKYDADGNLLIQKDPNSTTLYLPGEQITLTSAAPTSPAGVRYFSLPGGAVGYRTGTGVGYGFEVTDLHGTPYLQLDNTAQVPTWRQFTPFGAARGAGAVWPDNRTFLGKATDTTDGYSYAGNNPSTFEDPTGLRLQGCEDCGYNDPGDPAHDYVPKRGRHGRSAWVYQRPRWPSRSIARGGVRRSVLQSLVNQHRPWWITTDTSVHDQSTNPHDLDGPSWNDALLAANTSALLLSAVAAIGELGLNPGADGAVATFGSIEEQALERQAEVDEGSAERAVESAEGAAEATSVQSIASSEIRFSQRSVSAGVAEREARIRDTGDWYGDPLDIVRMPDDGLTSLDNRRLLAAKRLGIEARAVVHDFDEPIASEVTARRFPSTRGAVPTTWGEAVTNRIGRQGAGYRNAHPYGSSYTVWEGN